MDVLNAKETILKKINVSFIIHFFLSKYKQWKTGSSKRLF